jgi:hypothetical protein
VAGRLEFTRLILVSAARNYEVKFHAGVNIIAGPISTGKTSILELLDYACGAKSPPSYPELSKCSEVIVEAVVGGEVLAIRRALHGMNAKAWLYQGSLDQVLSGEAEGVELSARHVSEAPSVSAEILKRLGLGAFKVKTAPSKDASETSSFSLRDLLLLVYVDQDRMGSKTSFFEDDHFHANKWRAAFEICHGIFDAAAAATADALRAAEKEHDDLVRYLADVRRFLDQFKVPRIAELEEERTKTADLIVGARAEIARLRADERSRLGENTQLAIRRNRLAESEKALTARIDELRRNAKQLGRLRVQYERELEQWRFLEESEAILGSIPVSRCPACFQDVSLVHNPEQCHLCRQALQKGEKEVSLSNRVRAASRRITDLDAYVKDVEGTIRGLEQQRLALEKERSSLDGVLRRIQASTLLAETRAIVEANETLSALETRRRRIDEHVMYRKRAAGEGSALLALEERIRQLREVDRLAREHRMSPEAVIGDLSAWYQALLSDIRFPELREAAIDKGSYRPLVRGQPYRELSSKGAISLAVAAWHLALMEYALKSESPSQFPCLLMLDSPLSHVGRDTSDPEFRDQKLVDGFYAVLARLHERRDRFQMLICDNRPPAAAREMVSVEFTGDPRVGRYGLIDDEHPPLP